MASGARVLGLECLRCRALFDGPRLFSGCPRCCEQGIPVNLTVKLDLSPLAGLTADRFPLAPPTLWRYRELLPVSGERLVSLGEGGTPLIHLQRLGRRLGLSRLYAKDESQNPTWSYKDRLCTVAITHALESGAQAVTIASTGNHGAATAAYAARAGLPCVIFTLASVPDTMKTLMQAYGAAVVACATPEARWRLMREGVERLGWYPAGGYVIPPVGSNPYGIEGYKTLAYEVAEALDWSAPDVLVVPSAYSDGLFGIWKGMTELHALGLVKELPRMVAAEPFGPLANALRKGLDTPEAVEGGSSVAFSIASRYGTYQGLTALRESHGTAVEVSDPAIIEAQRALAREEGLFVEPSAAAGLSAVMRLKEERAIEPDQVIVIVLTSGGLKDPGASRSWLPAVPLAGDSFDDLLRTLRESYGLVLDH
ncbi:MAG: threonine synthase [Candidatus Rokubacteria bacterium]|nr:threonine synthase [Candidatus Rokubacteria bacterium]